ncbi:hypothetical protein [Microbacterium mangrovi]|uniref:hypothetical protein n=1 Tax=Microbacterium mangrovi TaxID=1348253 RepID=UPI00068CC891|nr:hypothetical protein [Microbacterium mangrovi]
MPMIDVYCTEGTFGSTHAVAQQLATAVMEVEQVPDIAMFRKNTAAFVHELPASAISNVDGESNYVRVQVLTNAGALDQAKRNLLVDHITGIVVTASGDPSLGPRTWVQMIEAPDGGWGLYGHAQTNADLVDLARAEIAAGRRTHEHRHP